MLSGKCAKCYMGFGKCFIDLDVYWDIGEMIG